MVGVLGFMVVRFSSFSFGRFSGCILSIGTRSSDHPSKRVLPIGQETLGLPGTYIVGYWAM